MRFKQLLGVFFTSIVTINAFTAPLLSVTVAPKKSYVNQQIIYTVKLLMPQVQWLDAEYQPPHVNDALIISLGETARYQTVIADVAYTVEEQRYAILPQKSGVLAIQPPLFTAMVVDGVAKRIQLNGEAKTVEVLPVPDSYTDKYWLPAERLVLSEHYDKPDTALKPGEALTRTITIKATGLPAELLPAFSFVNEKQWRVYPDAPVLKNRIDHGVLVGERTQTITYLFSQPAKIDALRLTWFNTHTHTQEVATLPEKKVLVATLVNKDSNTVSTQQSADSVEFGKKSIMIFGYVMAGVLCVVIGSMAVFYAYRAWHFRSKKQTRKCVLPPINPGDDEA